MSDKRNYEKHGYGKSGEWHPLFGVIHDMKQRCYNSNQDVYKSYGARGIGICDEWRNSNKTFIEWGLENGWKPGLKLDRIDNDGDYTPENCRFVASRENCLNQRSLRSTNKTGYKGVAVYTGNKFSAQITIHGKKIHLGVWDNKHLAAAMYNAAAMIAGYKTNKITGDINA